MARNSTSKDGIDALTGANGLGGLVANRAEARQEPAGGPTAGGGRSLDKMSRLTVRLRPDLKEALRDIAYETRAPQTAIINEALDEYVKRYRGR